MDTKTQIKACRKLFRTGFFISEKEQLFIIPIVFIFKVKTLNTPKYDI